MRLLLAAIVLAACGSETPKQSPPPTAPPLAGLWVGSSVAETDPISIEVTLEGDDFVAAPLGEGYELRLRTPKLDARELHGHLIQPPSRDYSYPAATPVTLARQGTKWRGEARALVDEVHFHLVIEDDGSKAWVREPGRNAGRFFGELTVRRSGDLIEFVRGESTAFTAKLDGDVLTVNVEQLGAPLELARATRETAPHFYPRPLGSYRYQPPKAASDGWNVASLTDANIDAAPVIAMVSEIVSSVPSTLRSPAIHSLLVARGGKLVLEEYFAGHTADSLHDTRSAGKSFATTLVGLAADSELLAVTDPVAKFMGGGKLEARKQAMTIEHLLTMSSGLECDDNDYENSKGNEDRMQGQSEQPDWHRYAWDLPMVRAPGAKGVYCSAGINLLGAPLKIATKMWIPDFFATAFAEPLGIKRYHFNLMPTREGYLGGGIRLRPRDFAKLGQLFVSGGRWNGKQVLSESWINAAITPRSGINEPDDYGYGWWRHTYDTGGEKLGAYYASGNGGQLIIVVPSRELVIAFMAGNYGDYRTWRLFRDELALRIVRAAK